MADMVPRLREVRAGERPFTLELTWADRIVTHVDVFEPVHNFKVYAPLRDDRALFERVRLGEFGADIVWSDEIDMSADLLWRLALKQGSDSHSARVPHASR